MLAAPSTDSSGSAAAAEEFAFYALLFVTAGIGIGLSLGPVFDRFDEEYGKTRQFKTLVNWSRSHPAESVGPAMKHMDREHQRLLEYSPKKIGLPLPSGWSPLLTGCDRAELNSSPWRTALKCSPDLVNQYFFRARNFALLAMDYRDAFPKKSRERLRKGDLDEILFDQQ